jgi:hypothetical protein
MSSGQINEALKEVYPTLSIGWHQKAHYGQRLD